MSDVTQILSAIERGDARARKTPLHNFVGLSETEIDWATMAAGIGGLIDGSL